MAVTPLPPSPDNSSNGRKIAVPALAGAISILSVIAVHALGLPISLQDQAIGAPAEAVVVAAILDLVLPDRFLA